MAIEFFVPGHPAPQGSKRHVGGGRMIEASKNVKTWREYVRTFAYDYIRSKRAPIIDGPIHAKIEFVMPRTRSAPKSYTPYHTKRPDVDKLTRCVFDAMTDIAWRDDSQVVSILTRKRMAELDEHPGAFIHVSEINE